MSGGIDDHDPLDARQAVAALDDLVTQPGFAEASLPQIDGRELFARARFGAVRGVERILYEAAHLFCTQHPAGKPANPR